MKYPFKLSKTNIIYASIVAIIILFLNIRIYGFDFYAVGLSFGSIFGIILFPILFALLFWFLLGKKEKGGTTTFNIILTLMLFGAISEFSQRIDDRQKPIEDLENAVFNYKESTLRNPDSTDVNYAVLSSNVEKVINDLIRTSVGEEKKVYVTLKGYLEKSDSINVTWNNAYAAFMEPRILDFTQLNNYEEFKFQKNVVQIYIDQSQNYKMFVQNRVDYLKTQTNHIDKSNKAFKGFLKGVTKKDSIQKPIFMPYINAHINYGKEMYGILELLEKEKGNWKYENEKVTFQNPQSQQMYDELLNDAVQNETIVNELSEKLIQIM